MSFDLPAGDYERRVCSLIARLGQAHYSEIRSALSLQPGAWRRLRARLLAEGRIAETFPGMYELTSRPTADP